MAFGGCAIETGAGVSVTVFCCFQHTLVTEIRELVFPEDRTRYDELVYRRDAYLTDRDRHRVSQRRVQD